MSPDRFTPLELPSPRPRLASGLVQVYTGKTKAAAAVGLVFRAVGQGLLVRFIQFMGGPRYHEELFLLKRYFPQLKVSHFGRPCVRAEHEPQAALGCRACRACFAAGPEDLTEQDRTGAALALDLARLTITAGGADLVILDEVNTAVSLGLLSLDQVLDLIARKHHHLELVLTGPDAHPRVIDRADLVTATHELTPVRAAAASADPPQDESGGSPLAKTL